MGEARSGKKRGAPAPVVGRLLEPLYAAAVRRRNAGFDNGREAARFVGASGKKIPVISIGNLSVGGTGKTPLVMHTVRVLMEHGMRPCVAMRGYSKSKDGAADETDAYRRAFPGMVVVAQADRTAGLREVLGDGRAGDGRGRDATREEPAGDQRATRIGPAGEQRGTRIGPAGDQRGTRGPDVIVLDDGFQHRQIARDVDVVLIDATPGRSVFADRLLPAGWLREPVENLRRASMVVLTHAEMATREDVEGLKREIGKYMRGPVAVTRHVWVGLRHDVRKEEPGSENRGTQGAAGSENRGTREGMSLEVLRGRRVVGCCAIGHPDGFRASLERAVGGACEVMALPDHDPFGAGTVEKVCAMARRAGAEYLVVTDKDWSKLRNVAAERWPCPVVRPELALEFDEGEGVFEELVVRAGGGT